MEKFKEGQSVKYKGNDTHIEKMHKNKTCIIANPDWSWDDEALCVAAGTDYDCPYWIKVKISELSPANK